MFGVQISVDPCIALSSASQKMVSVAILETTIRGKDSSVSQVHVCSGTMSKPAMKIMAARLRRKMKTQMMSKNQVASVVALPLVTISMDLITVTLKFVTNTKLLRPKKQRTKKISKNLRTIWRKRFKTNLATTAQLINA